MHVARTGISKNEPPGVERSVPEEGDEQETAGIIVGAHGMCPKLHSRIATITIASRTISRATINIPAQFAFGRTICRL
jgi:hypothetical protein